MELVDMGWFLLLGILIAILWLAKWGILIYAIITGIFCGGDSGNNAGGWCPHGYDSFGCQPECPLYEHCWGPRKK